MDGKITVEKKLAEKETFRNELSKLFEKYGYILTWEGSTEAWLTDLNPQTEAGDYK